MSRQKQDSRNTLAYRPLLAFRKVPSKPYLRFLDQVAQLVKQGLDVEQIVVVARLRRGTGERLALVVSQKEQVGGAGSFAALVADGRAPVVGAGMAAVELYTGQVQARLVQAQERHPQLFPRAILAPFVEVVIHARPGQGLAGKELFKRQ